MVKKKSKYRHVIINKKKYYFYHIVWLDILGDSGHASAQEFDNMKPAVMNTYAYIYKKTKKLLLTSIFHFLIAFSNIPLFGFLSIERFLYFLITPFILNGQ